LLLPFHLLLLLLLLLLPYRLLLLLLLLPNRLLLLLLLLVIQTFFSRWLYLYFGSYDLFFLGLPRLILIGLLCFNLRQCFLCSSCAAGLNIFRSCSEKEPGSISVLMCSHTFWTKAMC
jgi:hypothetical protein